MTTILRHWVRSFCLWLALAIVLTCAIGSFGSPVRASNGSAFNAFTSDVSLGPSRAAMPERQREGQAPTGGGADQAKALPALSAILAPAPSPALPVFFGRQDAPPATVTAGAVGARAPPLA